MVCVLGRVCGWCFYVVLGDYSDVVVVVCDDTCCCCDSSHHGDILVLVELRVVCMLLLAEWR